MLLVLEAVSYLAQRALAEHAEEHTTAQLYGAGPGARPPRAGTARASCGRGLGLVAVVLFVYSLAQLLDDPPAPGQVWENAVRVLSGFFPPVFSLEIAYGIFESVIMAISCDHLRRALRPRHRACCRPGT